MRYVLSWIFVFVVGPFLVGYAIGALSYDSPVWSLPGRVWRWLRRGRGHAPKGCYCAECGARDNLVRLGMPSHPWYRCVACDRRASIAKQAAYAELSAEYRRGRHGRSNST